MIIISFDSKSLHDSCVTLAAAEDLLGSTHASALISLISDVEAFENAAELIDFLGNQVKVCSDDSLFVVIGSDYRAKLVVAGTRFARDIDGRVIWATVARLKLVDISRQP